MFSRRKCELQICKRHEARGPFVCQPHSTVHRLLIKLVYIDKDTLAWYIVISTLSKCQYIDYFNPVNILIISIHMFCSNNSDNQINILKCNCWMLKILFRYITSKGFPSQLYIYLKVFSFVVC